MRQAPNWKVFEIADEDHSRDRDFRDPREMETLEEAVAPGYDSSGESLSNPLPPFHPRLNQFDTQIWEMCDIGSPKVLMPHRDSSSIPYHYQIQPIMNWADVDSQTAEVISEIGLSLNATKEMMRTFCKDAKVDLKSFLLQMSPLVNGLDALEFFEEPQTPEIPAGIRINHGALKTLYKMLPDENGEEEEIEPKETGSTIGYHIFKDFSEIKDKRRELWVWYKDFYMDSTPDGLHDRIFKPEAEGYFTDDEIETEWYPKFNWVRQQDSKYVDLLKKIRRGSREEIGRLATMVMESKIELSKLQTTVFFTEWNIRRDYLEKDTRDVVHRMIKRIYSADGRLGYIGFQMHLMQNGDHPKWNYTLQKHEWSQVWEAYKLEKELQGSQRELVKAKKELAALEKEILLAK